MKPSWKYRFVQRNNIVVPYRYEEFNDVFIQTLKSKMLLFGWNMIAVGIIFLFILMELNVVSISNPVIVSSIGFMSYISISLFGMMLIVWVFSGIINLVSFIYKILTERNTS